MNSILLDAQVTWIAPDKSSLKTCFFSKLSEISKCSRLCMADIEGSDGFCPMFLIEVFGVADIKDVKVGDTIRVTGVIIGQRPTGALAVKAYNIRRL